MHDLYKETGGCLSQNEIENIIGTEIYFTMYQAIIRAIPREWDRIMQLNTRNHNIIKPLVIECITKDKKGGTSIRQIWNMCNKEEVPISQTRWNKEYDNAENVDWAFSYTLPFRCRLNAGVKYIQYQVLHRTLITNEKLNQFNFLDHNTCDNCNEIETMRHLLVHQKTMARRRKVAQGKN